MPDKLSVSDVLPALTQAHLQTTVNSYKHKNKMGLVGYAQTYLMLLHTGKRLTYRVHQPTWYTAAGNTGKPLLYTLLESWSLIFRQRAARQGLWLHRA